MVRTTVGATFMVQGIDSTVIVDVSIASTVEIMQQCWEQCPSPLPRAVWLLQPGFFVFVCLLRYSFNQIHTIHNSFEIFQPIFQDGTSWYSMTIPTKFFESASGRDELNMKWVYWQLLLNQLLNVNSFDLRLNFQPGLAKNSFLNQVRTDVGPLFSTNC